MIPNHLQADLHDSTACNWTCWRSYSQNMDGWTPVCQTMVPAMKAWSLYNKTMQEYRVNHIIFTAITPNHDGLAEKFLQNCKKHSSMRLERKVLTYTNPNVSTPTCLYTSNLHLQCRSLQNRCVLDHNYPCDNSARRLSYGLDSWEGQDKNKNEKVALSHDLYLGQDVMMQDPTSKQL